MGPLRTRRCGHDDPQGSDRLDEHLGAFRDGVIVRAMAEFGGRDPEAGFGSVAGEMLEEAEELVDFVH